MRTDFILTLFLTMICTLALGCPPDRDDAGDDDAGDDDAGDDDAGDDDAGDDDAGDDDTTGNTEPGGPEVLSLLANPTTLSEGDTVVFTATVTDEDGTDDILGGQLASHGGSVFHGAFTQISGGTFALETSWAAFNQVQVIEFVDQDTWTFEATFTDTDGHEGSEGVEVVLTCGGTSACVGHCGINLMTDVHHCGECSNGCDYACVEGECRLPEWLDSGSYPVSWNCEDACNDLGATCLYPTECDDYAINHPGAGYCSLAGCEPNLGECQGYGIPLCCCL